MAALVEALRIKPGDEFRFNGAWLEVALAKHTDDGEVLLTVAGEPGEKDRVFIAEPMARRRVRVS